MLNHIIKLASPNISSDEVLTDSPALPRQNRNCHGECPGGNGECLFGAAGNIIYLKSPKLVTDVMNYIQQPPKSYYCLSTTVCGPDRSLFISMTLVKVEFARTIDVWFFETSYDKSKTLFAFMNDVEHFYKLARLLAPFVSVSIIAYFERHILIASFC